MLEDISRSVWQIMCVAAMRNFRDVIEQNHNLKKG
jgi:hypothetical protein